jgi:adenylate cyclase class IV
MTSHEVAMRNLELKARCPDPALLDELAARAVAGGAIFVRAMGQRDTYFSAPRGRLKLREWWREDAPRGPAAIGPRGGAQQGEHDAEGAREDGEAAPSGAVLIAYARPDDAGSRLSDYLLSPVGEPASLREALACALGVRAVVEKRRALYRYGRTRIHLDRVAGLGAFVELETVLDADAPGVATEAAAEHRRAIALLGLDSLPAIAGSYGDLLAGGGETSPE